MKYPLLGFCLRARWIVAPALCALLLSVTPMPSSAAPPNDNLADAQMLPAGPSFSTTGFNGLATLEPFEKASGYPFVVDHTVWFSWTPTISGYLSASVAGLQDGVAPYVAVFKGPTPSAASYLSQSSEDGTIDPGAHVDAGQVCLICVAANRATGSFRVSGSVKAEPAFFTGETVLSNGVYYLSFAGGSLFGCYSYLSDSHYFYHFDLGYEYVFDANDGKSGVYLYDFASKTFFYTSPGFPFPYLYDFTLKTVLYYYPNTKSAGHYTTNPRYFYNFATGKIITK